MDQKEISEMLEKMIAQVTMPCDQTTAEMRDLMLKGLDDGSICGIVVATLHVTVKLQSDPEERMQYLGKFAQIGLGEVLKSTAEACKEKWVET